MDRAELRLVVRAKRTEELGIKYVFYRILHTFHFRCKGTTNIWNMQGFSIKMQIYLDFSGKDLLFNHQSLALVSD